MHPGCSMMYEIGNSGLVTSASASFCTAYISWLLCVLATCVHRQQIRVGQSIAVLVFGMAPDTLTLNFRAPQHTSQPADSSCIFVQTCVAAVPGARGQVAGFARNQTMFVMEKLSCARTAAWNVYMLACACRMQSRETHAARMQSIQAHRTTELASVPPFQDGFCDIRIL